MEQKSARLEIGSSYPRIQNQTVGEVSRFVQQHFNKAGYTSRGVIVLALS